jgi:mono/diheme cytochrome c family protein
MTATTERGTPNAERGVKKNRMRLLILAVAAVLTAAAGCRQKMGDQPYGRPLAESDFFEDGRMSRPLERGVIHRGQYLEFDPLVTGLTREEWSRAYAAGAAPKTDFGPAPNEDRARAIGAPRFDPPGFTPAAGDTAHPGPQIYVNEFPVPSTEDDLRRGQDRYTIYCAVCHGPLGNGEGKLWERRYLKPTSFHTTPVEPGESVELREGVWYERSDRPAQPGFARGGVPLGYSRNYSIIWRINIPMPEVPIGYYFEVITKGYAGMPSYAAQIPPADRWRIIAYIRVLQMSQRVQTDKLPADGGGKK